MNPSAARSCSANVCSRRANVRTATEIAKPVADLLAGLFGLIAVLGLAVAFLWESPEAKGTTSKIER